MKGTEICSVVLVMATVLGCGKISDLVKRSGGSDDLRHHEKVAEQALKIDIRSNPPSPGAQIVRRLAELDPALARFGPDIESAERAVIQKSIADVTRPTEQKKLARLRFPENPSTKFGEKVFRASSAPAALIFQGAAPAPPQDRTTPATLVTAIVAGLKQIFGESHNKATVGGGKGSKTETKDGVKTTMGAELMFRDDGSSVFGIQFDTEATAKDGSKLVTKLGGTVDGLDCPNQAGQVSITVKLQFGGESGGTGYTQDVQAFIRATVDDDANIASTTVDIVQGTREILRGDDIYVETGYTITQSFPVPRG